METRTETEIDGHRWRVTLTWRGAGQGRPVPTSLTLVALGVGSDRAEVSSTVLRQLPIGQLIAEMRPQPTGPDPAPRSPSGRPPKYNLDHYIDVALIYRNAVREGLPPIKAIAEHFGVPPQAARRWVHLARNRHNLLPAVRQGQAG